MYLKVVAYRANHYETGQNGKAGWKNGLDRLEVFVHFVEGQTGASSILILSFVTAKKNARPIKE